MDGEWGVCTRYLIGGAVLKRTERLGDCILSVYPNRMDRYRDAGKRAFFVQGVAVDDGAGADVVQSRLDSHGDGDNRTVVDGDG